MKSETKIIVNDDNEAILYLNECEVANLGNIEGKTATELEELKSFKLKELGIEKEEQKVEVITKTDDFMVDNQADLSLVRTTMRKMMKELTSDKTSMEEKRRNLGYYNTINSQAKMIISACLAELAIEKARPKEIIEVEKK